MTHEGTRRDAGAALAAEHRKHAPRYMTPDERERVLLLLSNTPGYRALLRQRISDEQRRRRLLDSRMGTRRATFNRRHGAQ